MPGISGSGGIRDLLLVDCIVRPLVPGAPATRTALALRGGRVLASGSREELSRMLSADHTVVDCGGAAVLPAFHDAHVHFLSHGMELRQVDLQKAATLDDALALVGERVAATPGGRWVLGSGFALERWGIDAVDRHMLDRVAPNHPVLVRSQDHHSAWVNSLALEIAGITGETPDPPDGTLVRGEGGEITGWLLERALAVIETHVPDPEPAEVAEALRESARDLASKGIATAHHMAYEPAEYWRATAAAASEEGFPIRIWACVPQENLEDAAAIGLSSGQGGAGFTVGGAKFFADGALGSRTARMFEPYAGGDERGVFVHGPDILSERFGLAISHGFTPVTHAIGDEAVAAVLDALEATEAAWRGAGMRPRVEHVQHIREEDVARFGRLGLTASMQPIHLTFDAPSIRRLLPDRTGRAHRVRSLQEAGATLAFGSDTPVAPPDVLAGIRAATLRRGVDGEVFGESEAITVEDALVAYTSGAARAIGREERSGMLAPGFDADLVLLSHDPVENLSDCRVVATLKGGQATYDPAAIFGEVYSHA